MGSGAPMNCRLNGDKCDGTPDAPPSAPTNLRSPAASYDVYAGSTLATNVTGTTATVAGLALSTAYSFTVRARDNYDNLSGPSNAVSVTTDDVIGGGNYARVGYFVQWGVYARNFVAKDVDTSGAADELTHINYAFTNLDPVNLTCLNGVTRGTTCAATTTS